MLTRFFAISGLDVVHPLLEGVISAASCVPTSVGDPNPLLGIRLRGLAFAPGLVDPDALYVIKSPQCSTLDDPWEQRARLLMVGTRVPQMFVFRATCPWLDYSCPG